MIILINRLQLTVSAVIQRIDDNKNHGLRSIMDRPKIEYLAFGQKSEYQCEDVSKVDPNFWYYTYTEHNAGQDYQPAHELFKGVWDQQIREETDIALSNYDPSNPIPNNFYIEEFEFNITDAMKHVNTIIRQQSNDKISLMVNLNYDLIQIHIPKYPSKQRNNYDIVSN